MPHLPTTENDTVLAKPVERCPLGSVLYPIGRDLKKWAEDVNAGEGCLG